MPESRAERFAVLDSQLEAAVKNTGDRGTTVVIGESDPVELSPASLKTLYKVVHALAEGSEPMLTTTEAADVLGVSRPYLTRLLKAGRLPHRKKGTHHLVPLDALHAFKTERDRKLDELAGLAVAEEDLGVR